MADGFRAAGDGYTAEVDAGEAAVLRSLIEQLTELLEADTAGDEPVDELAASLGLADLGKPGPTSAPDDPVLARLFPDAYSGDNEAAADFRRYTESGLRAGKSEIMSAMLAAIPPGGGTIELPADRAPLWLRGLNDLRLALGTRLEVTEETEMEIEDLDPADPRFPAYVTYSWLGYLQDSLVAALS